MKQSVLKNNSQSELTIPLREKEEQVVVQEVVAWKTLAPGEELVLGPDYPTDKVEYYKQFEGIDVNVVTQEVPEGTFAGVEVPGVKAAEKLEATIVKYDCNDFVTIKFKPAVISKKTNPGGTTDYWVGIGVVAPEGAVALARSTGKTQEALATLKAAIPASSFDKRVLDGKDGWYFYAGLNHEHPVLWSRTQWLAEDGSVIEDVVYYMDVTDIKLAK